MYNILSFNHELGELRYFSIYEDKLTFVKLHHYISTYSIIIPISYLSLIQSLGLVHWTHQDCDKLGTSALNSSRLIYIWPLVNTCHHLNRIVKSFFLMPPPYPCHSFIYRWTLLKFHAFCRSLQTMWNLKMGRWNRRKTDSSYRQTYCSFILSTGGSGLAIMASPQCHVSLSWTFHDICMTSILLGYFERVLNVLKYWNKENPSQILWERKILILFS